MKKDVSILRYDQAAAILPLRLRKYAMQLPEIEKAAAEEVRLRVGQPVTVLLPTGEKELGAVTEQEDMESLCNLATEFSRYAATETLREGFLPVQGGFRVGLSGTVVMKNGVNSNMRNFSSAAIRIGREKKGIAEDLIPQLFSEDRFQNTLILSAPGGGKTTLLRDLVRCLSNKGIRISLIDERSEVAVLYRGEPQMDVGTHTDVLEACPKAIGIQIMLRAMNPQMIAVDEITAQEDLKAMAMASGCGVGLLATIHAADIGELTEKPLYRQLLSDKVFRRAIRIIQHQGVRNYIVEDLSG